MRSFIEQFSRSVEQPWPIVMINLDRATGRLRDVSRTLEDNGLSFTRFSAIDGEALPPDLVSDLTGSHRFKRPLTRAEVGCFASHLMVWHAIAQTGHPRVIVLEDDARLSTDARTRLEAVARSDETWDILKICYPAQSERNSGTPVVTRPRRIPRGTTGYVITRDAAARLVATTLPFTRPVDIELKTWWEHGLSVKVASPPIGTPADDHEATSAIAASRARAGHKAPLGRFLRNARYQLRRRVGRMLCTVPARPMQPDTGPLHPAMIRLIEAVR